MIKIKCSIIKDLIPLYIEDMTSQESKELVELHLEGCGECLTYIESIRNDHKGLNENNTSALKKIRNSILKDKRKNVITAVFLSIILVVLISFSLTAPVYIPYNEDEISVVNLHESGYFLVELQNNATNYRLDKHGDEFHIVTWTTTLNKFLDRQRIRSIVINNELQDVSRIWYSEYDGSGDIVIYENEKINGGMVSLPRLVISYYLLFAIGLSIITGLFLLIFKKNKKIKLPVKLIFSLSIFFIMSTIITKGFNYSSYSPLRDISQILIITIILEITYYYIVSLGKYKNWDQEKGIDY